MAVVANTTTTGQFSTVTVKELDFVSRFENNWQSLIDIMGISRPIRKTPGTKLVSYTGSITLQNGTVAEGDEIPLSQATVVEAAHADIALKKYRKRVTIEAVDKYGAAIAVQKTDDALLNELTSNVLTSFYTFAATGTGTGTANTFQEAIATAIGKAVDKFKTIHRDFSRVAVFVNTMDFYTYLGTAPITIQTENGIQYIKNFMGADTVFITSDVTAGTVIATPADNIVLYYIDPSDGDFAELGLEYTTSNGPTNLIGVHKEGVYDRASGDTHAIMGMVLWAEYLDGIGVVTF